MHTNTIPCKVKRVEILAKRNVISRFCYQKLVD